MNSDAPYESAVRTSLIPLHGRKSWGQLPPLLLKIEGGVAKLFLALNLRRKKLFYFSMEAYKYTIMCNYLNKYINLNDARYIQYTSL
jgi:hypothetical protein